MDAAAERRLAEALAGDERVLFAYLFGSHAAGTAGSRSDVDVGAYLREPLGADDDLDLIGLVTGALKRDDVDVVVLNKAPLTLAFEVLKGKLLVSKDEDMRVVEEARIMSRYHDRVHYMKRHLRLSTERTAERGWS